MKCHQLVLDLPVFVTLNFLQFIIWIPGRQRTSLSALFVLLEILGTAAFYPKPVLNKPRKNEAKHAAVYYSRRPTKLTCNFKYTKDDI